MEVGVGEYGTKGIRKIEEERMRLRRGDLLKSAETYVRLELTIWNIYFMNNLYAN